MDSDLYDEFGNYIGPELGSEGESESSEEEEEQGMDDTYMHGDSSFAI
jgi:116 kDa U5 small nuclear ribonucleoprotein component